MKTFASVLILVLLAVPGFNSRAGVNPGPTIDGKGPKVSICFEIGRKSRQCKGIGICSFQIDLGMVAPGENRVKANAWIESGRLNVSIDKTTLESNTYNTYFESGTFRMEENFELPKEVATAIGVNAYTIRTGNFYIVQSGVDANTLLLTF